MEFLKLDFSTSIFAPNIFLSTQISDTSNPRLRPKQWGRHQHETFFSLGAIASIVGFGLLLIHEDILWFQITNNDTPQSTIC